jgi:hypothetical protein
VLILCCHTRRYLFAVAADWRFADAQGWADVSAQHNLTLPTPLKPWRVCSAPGFDASSAFHRRNFSWREGALPRIDALSGTCYFRSIHFNGVTKRRVPEFCSCGARPVVAVASTEQRSWCEAASNRA